MQQSFSFWHLNVDNLFEKLHARAEGLTTYEAKQKGIEFKDNRIAEKKRKGNLTLFWSQFKSPLILLLWMAALLSAFLGDRTNASIIFLILLASGLLSFIQEKGAVRAVEKLISLVQVKTTVLRDGKETKVDTDEIVPGDIALLRAGDIIPGDCFILEAKDCFADEASLTGESFLVEKKEGVLKEKTALRERSNVLFMGTHVMSGTAKVLVVLTGKATEYGKISQHLALRVPETSFEVGIRRFGYMLIEITFILVILIFAFNIYFHRPVLDSFMFALALAVGLTPQLLPVIFTINLAHGAKRMAKLKVVVKRLSSIENFGSINVLCCDKTGTLTAGNAVFDRAVDTMGKTSERCSLYAAVNAAFQTGYVNPIDQAILKKTSLDSKAWKKLDEVPYDFLRKRLSILTVSDQKSLLISKGAFFQILSICKHIETADGKQESLTEGKKGELSKQFEKYAQEGFRVLALAYRFLEKNVASMQDETDMIFMGFLLFLDPPKTEIIHTLKRMHEMGIEIKMVTGDNRYASFHVAQQVGLCSATASIENELLLGQQLETMSDVALRHLVREKSVFAEVDPNQKERLVLALRKMGAVVGYLGDGINDVTALHAADVGISVNLSADVAKETADIVLLKKDLSVLLDGIREGRKTFANSMKYIFMATSANFGNMFSMAAVSLFIPFLPLLPKQILLLNLFTDIPEVTISTDRVDPEIIAAPVKWDMAFIRRFMVVFGLISSLFDIVTFVVLLYFMKAAVVEFRTGWFIESIISAALIVLVIRTRKPFFLSRPSSYLTLSVFAVILLAALLPYTPLSRIFELAPLPLSFYAVIGAIVLFYVIAVEVAKKVFYNIEAIRERWKNKKNGFIRIYHHK